MINIAPSLVPTALLQAQLLASQARFDESMALCQKILDSHADDTETLMRVGVLLQNFGFLSAARQCFDRGRVIAPHDPRPVINLANLARELADHGESHILYAALVKQIPDNEVVRRNALVSLEYDPNVSASDRLEQAKAWGEWAIARAGRPRRRPAMQPLRDRPLRVGYVSADFCQHPVGLYVRVVLAAHDPDRVTAFAYSAGRVDDWVTTAVRNACSFRDVSALDDRDLAAQIRLDEIDVLVDLSGHTAGSRLTAFAHRPAPVQVSWLGYFASTGLSVVDAVLLDDWHAPAGAEAQYVEPIVRLRGGRFCYTPLPDALAVVAPPPSIDKGYVTFGSFNNTAKLNAGVFDVWARLLLAVPGSRLVLKWRTFNDEAVSRAVRGELAKRGILPERLELRGPSFHSDMLKEYADIDIALDPFPFTGGLTSCEALWMGVPVVTWPKGQVVSRQTFAFLSAITLSELAAQNADDYVRIAVELAGSGERLLSLRREMRARMQASTLMDVTGFTRQFEQVLIDLYQGIAARVKDNAVLHSKTLLHVGPGHRRSGASLPVAFQTAEWREVRLDIDPANEPDILGSMLDMAAVADASVDAVYSSHNIEHVYAYEVPLMLKEFLRVLKPEGFLVVTCPDLQVVCALVAEGKLTDAAYQSKAGPITPLDILYGHGASLADGNYYMAHKGGFTEKSLVEALTASGFVTIASKRRPAVFELWAMASKGAMSEAALRELAGRVLPG